MPSVKKEKGRMYYVDGQGTVRSYVRGKDDPRNEGVQVAVEKGWYSLGY